MSAYNQLKWTFICIQQEKRDIRQMHDKLSHFISHMKHFSRPNIIRGRRLTLELRYQQLLVLCQNIAFQLIPTLFVLPTQSNAFCVLAIMLQNTKQTAAIIPCDIWMNADALRNSWQHCSVVGIRAIYKRTFWHLKMSKMPLHTQK